jgi:hypothetical protein
MTTPLATACGLAALAVPVAVLVPAYRRALLWFAIAAAGQGAALTLVVAGPFPRYQHYAPLVASLSQHPWALGMLAAEAGAVLIALALRAWPRESATVHVAGWRVVVALALATCTAATVSPDVRRYVTELAFAIAVQLAAIGATFIAVRSIPGDAAARLDDRVRRFLGGAGTVRLDAVAWTAAGAAFAASAVLCVMAYGRHPHVPDEVVYLHHAKYLAKGVLTMPLPPVVAGFDVDLMEYEPARWFSPVPPGWPIVLAAGTWLGAAWLVNPVIAGANVLLAFLVLGAVYSRGVARASAILLAASPWFLFLGMSFMTHQLTLCFALVAALGVQRARESGADWIWALVAGAGVGLTSLIRPLDAAIVGLVIAAWAFGAGGRRLSLRALAALGVATVASAALTAPYNKLMTGDPLKAPINAYVDKHYAPNANAYGFGPDRGMGWPLDPNPGHGPVDGVINANLNTFGINTDLFGWGTGSLVFVAWLLCSGRWRREDTAMLAVVLAFVVAYFFYYFSGGPDFGARYWFPIIVPLVALSVRGIDAMSERLGAGTWLAAAALCTTALVTYIPWRAVDKYHNYRGMRPDVRELASRYHMGRDLVLVRGQRFPDYASAFAQNPVDLQGPATIYAWDRDEPTRQALLRAYADRKVWLVDGPTVSGDGYRVVGGPLSAHALLAAASR